MEKSTLAHGRIILPREKAFQDVTEFRRNFFEASSQYSTCVCQVSRKTDNFCGLCKKKMSHEKPFLNTLNFAVFTRDTKVVGSSRNDFARTWMSRCACETFYPNFVTFQNTFKTHFKTRSICSRMPNRPSMWDGAFYPNKIFTQIDSAPLQDKCKCYLQKKKKLMQMVVRMFSQLALVKAKITYLDRLSSCISIFILYGLQ